MNAVQVEMAEQEPTFAPVPGALREQAAERLAAHRERRLRVAARAAGPVAAEAGPRAVTGRAERIAAAVAERYAQTQSYRAFLAAETANAVRLAEAAAEVAARNAEAIAAARRVLLVELEEMAQAERTRTMEPVASVAFSGDVVKDGERAAHEPGAAPADRELRVVECAEADPADMEPTRAEPAAAKSVAGGLTVRLYEDAGRGGRETTPRAGDRRESSGRGRAETFGVEVERAMHEARMLDEEIAYRQSPMEELERTSVAIPGNLLEFPRQLVAARKARPRYAEGPLREDADEAGSQLRIFEVEAVQTAADPVESGAPEWSSIWLDALAQPVVEETAEQAEYPMALRPETAAVSRRVMAAMVDGCLIAMAFVGFATLFVYGTKALPTLPLAAAASVVVLASLYLMYQMLFFTFGEATPGMRYARIGLCTFGDENPTRAAMRRRTFAAVLAACPVGLGLFWALLDDDRLGWHDRISRMYPRSY